MFQIFDRLQKLGVCLCYTSSLKIVKEIADNVQSDIVGKHNECRLIRLIACVVTSI